MVLVVAVAILEPESRQRPFGVVFRSRLMLWFDIVCTTIAIASLLFLRNACSKVVAYQFIIQFIFDILFIQCRLYEIIDTRWFFLVKGLILALSIYIIISKTKPSYIVLILFSTMMFHYGRWLEEILYLGNTGIFYRYFLPYMVLNSTLQILYLLGTTHAGSAIRNRTYRLLYRNDSNNHFGGDMRLLNTFNGVARQ